MPEKILELLESNSLTEEQLATRLNVSIEELKSGMEYLMHMGYIKSSTINPTGSCSGSCGSNCGKCSSVCYSSTGSAYTLWEIV